MHPILSQLAHPSASGQRHLAVNEQQTPPLGAITAQSDQANTGSFQHFFEAESGNSSHAEADILEGGGEDIVAEKNAEDQGETVGRSDSEVKILDTAVAAHSGDRKHRASTIGVDAKRGILDITQTRQHHIDNADHDGSSSTVEVRSLPHSGAEHIDRSKIQTPRGTATIPPVATSQEPFQRASPKIETQSPPLQTKNADLMVASQSHQSTMTQAKVGTTRGQSGISGMGDVLLASSSKMEMHLSDQAAITGSQNRLDENKLKHRTGQVIARVREDSQNLADHKTTQPQPAPTTSASSDQINRHMTQLSSFSTTSNPAAYQNAWDQPANRTKENRRFPEPAPMPLANSSANLPTKNLFLTTNPVTHFQVQPNVTKAAASDSILASPSDTALASPLHQSVTTMRAELPIHVARQLAEVVQQMPTRRVDITLSPDELGRVRMSVSTSESGITVNVLAERQETLDLLRRHIEQLSQEFQALGYKDIAFSFAGAESNSADGDNNSESETHKETATSEPDEGDTTATQIRLSTGATAGLDLRL